MSDPMQEYLDTLPACRVCGERPDDCSCGDAEYAALTQDEEQA